MLIDTNGKQFRAEKLPKGGRAKEAVLATLSEVLEPAPQKGGSFSLGERARLVERAK